MTYAADSGAAAHFRGDDRRQAVEGEFRLNQQGRELVQINHARANGWRQCLEDLAHAMPDDPSLWLQVARRVGLDAQLGKGTDEDESIFVDLRAAPVSPMTEFLMSWLNLALSRDGVKNYLRSEQANTKPNDAKLLELEKRHNAIMAEQDDYPS